MIADLEARARDLAGRSREMRDRIRRATATQRSPDGVVTATVAPNGSLQHIEFSPGAAEFSHAELSEVVMATVRRAQAQAARQVVSVVEPQFGGTAAMDFLTGSIPPEEPVRSVEPVEAVDPTDAGDSDLPLPRSLWAPPGGESGTGAAPR